MKQDTKAKNIQTKRNLDVLSSLKAKPQANQQNLTFSGTPHRSVSTNQKSKPIKVDKKL